LTYFVEKLRIIPADLRPEPLRVGCRVRCSRKERRSRPGRRETVLFDAALAPCPAGASGNPTATAPDHVFNIEFAGRTGVEAFLDFRPQPGELVAAPFLMLDRGDDGSLAAAIRSFAHLRSHELFESGWELYSGGGHCRSSIGDARVSSNRQIGTVAKT
jgi:hypothetical protein